MAYICAFSFVAIFTCLRCILMGGNGWFRFQYIFGCSIIDIFDGEPFPPFAFRHPHTCHIKVFPLTIIIYLLEQKLFCTTFSLLLFCFCFFFCLFFLPLIQCGLHTLSIYRTNSFVVHFEWYFILCAWYEWSHLTTFSDILLPLVHQPIFHYDKFRVIAISIVLIQS